MNFWRKKRVLITGASGFLGKHLVKMLRGKGAVITAPTRFDVDLFSFESTYRAMLSHRPEIIFHLAAFVGGIGKNMKFPSLFFIGNMKMGIEVIGAAAGWEKATFVQTGTICSMPKELPMTGVDGWTPIVRPFIADDLFTGYPEDTNAPYGVAKLALRTLLKAYVDEGRISKAAYVVPTNLFGPGDHFGDGSHVIPEICAAILKAKKSKRKYVQLKGYPQATRDFLYVEDACRGLIKAAELADNTTPTMLLGTGIEHSIQEVAELVKCIANFNGAIRWAKALPPGQPRRCVDPSFMNQHKLLQMPFVEGLERTVADIKGRMR